jgi:hypothetical protein
MNNTTDNTYQAVISASEMTGGTMLYYITAEDGVNTTYEGTQDEPLSFKVLVDDKEVILYGDANADGVVTAGDAAMVIQRIVDDEFEMPICSKTEDWEKYLDVDASGRLTSNDAAYILKKFVEQGIKFPAEN